MWENFSQRARKCDNYAAAADEALWLFRQLKPSVLNEQWLEAQPNGADTFVAKCQECTERAQVSCILVPSFPHSAICTLPVLGCVPPRPVTASKQEHSPADSKMRKRDGMRKREGELGGGVV